MSNRFTTPRFTALDSNGDPLPGAKLNFYESGTTNKADTFSDEPLTAANTNPVVADSAGRFADIFLQAQDYKAVLTDSADVTIWTADPVRGTLDATGDDFASGPQNPTDMTVLVSSGSVYNAVTKTLTALSAQTSALITAPVSNPRKDIVYIDRLTGVIGIETGVESVSPVDPAIPDDKLPVARVTLATTTTEITDSLIDDIRELNLRGAGDVVRRSTGVADGNVPVMDATGYPAADGSQITNLTGANVTGVAPSAFSARLLHVREEQASGTDGGTFTSGARRTRDLNVEKTREISGGGMVYTLPYDAQTGNFTVGLVVTGASSGATGLIVADDDLGGTGTLKITEVDAAFADGEVITDTSTGSADVDGGLGAANQVHLPAGDYFVDASAPAFQVGGHKLYIHDVTGAATLITGEAADASTGVQLMSRSRARGRFTLASASLVEVQHQGIGTNAGNGFGIASSIGDAEVYAEAMFWEI